MDYGKQLDTFLKYENENNKGDFIVTIYDKDYPVAVCTTAYKSICYEIIEYTFSKKFRALVYENDDNNDINNDINYRFLMEGSFNSINIYDILKDNELDIDEELTKWIRVYENIRNKFSFNELKQYIQEDCKYYQYQIVSNNEDILDDLINFFNNDMIDDISIFKNEDGIEELVKSFEIV